MKRLQKKSWIAILLALLCLSMTLCACTQRPPADGEGTTATTTAPATEEITTEPATEAVTQEQKVAYTVTVKTEAGNPVQGVRIQACKGELCLAPVTTDANGVATFQLDKTENISEYHVKINKFPTGYTGSTTEEYSFEAGSTAIVITIANPTA